MEGCKPRLRRRPLLGIFRDVWMCLRSERRIEMQDLTAVPPFRSASQMHSCGMYPVQNEIGAPQKGCEKSVCTSRKTPVRRRNCSSLFLARVIRSRLVMLRSSSKKNPCHSSKGWYIDEPIDSSFRPLWALPRLPLSWLFSFHHARISGEKTFFFQGRSKSRIVILQGPAYS